MRNGYQAAALVLVYLTSFFSIRLIRPVFHFFKRPDKRPTCLPRRANAFVVFSFSQNSSGHPSATLIRVLQSEAQRVDRASHSQHRLRVSAPIALHDHLSGV
jgi:hypothetical protein